MRAGLDLLPTWALEQKAAANRQLIEAMRLRLGLGSSSWSLPALSRLRLSCGNRKRFG